jgi:hypothetical protein
MKRFIKYYALEIYTVLALSFIVATAVIGNLSTVQKLVVVDALLFVLHEWEEGHYPGGFIKLISGLVGIRVDEDMSRASRIPAGILLLTLSIVPFVFDTTPLIIVAVATFGFIECFVHTMGIRLFHMKRFYTPGMVTAWLEFVVSVMMITYLAVNDIARWYDYVFGPLLMIVCFGLLQKTMTLMVGIRYSDMPKMIRTQWTRCD